MPPELTSDGEIPPDALFEGGDYFLGTMTPFLRSVNPLYDYPPHGTTWGGTHTHAGFYTGTDPNFYIGYHGIETSGSTSATEHRFRIKYQSKDPVTGAGVQPAECGYSSTTRQAPATQAAREISGRVPTHRVLTSTLDIGCSPRRVRPSIMPRV